MSSNERVLVVGAGPVGMVVALALTDAGIPVTVLEAGETVCQDMRAPAFHAPTIDMLEEIGLLDPLLEAATREPLMRFSDRGLGEQIELDMSVLSRRCRNPYDMLVGQQWFTAKAYEMLRGRDCEVLFSHVVTGVEQSENQATVNAETPNGPVKFVGPWVIGCDGASSAVRTSQNIEFEGYTWPERFLMIHTTEDFSDEHGRVNFIADGANWQLVVRIPFGPKPDDWLFRIVAGVPEGVADDLVLSPEYLQENLRRLRPEQAEFPIVKSSIYNVHQRVAKTYRTGRIILVGDAAHINNPMGGQGLNCGIHDALNLAKKFKQVWNDASQDGLLDLYDRQRRITNWEYIQKISVENKARNEEPDLDKRRETIDFLKSLENDDDARFAFLNRWSMGESLDFAENIE